MAARSSRRLSDRILGRTAVDRHPRSAVGQGRRRGRRTHGRGDGRAGRARRHRCRRHPLGADLRDAGRASAASAMGAISPAARWSISARRSASSRRNRSASREPSSPCAPSISAVRCSAAPRVSSVEAAFDAKVKIKNRNVVINSSGVPVVMGRNCEMVLLDEAGREKARHRVPYGAKLLADDGVTVAKGQKLAEWDPYTIPIITEKDGIAHYVDLTEGLSMREVVDEATGISSKVVVDWKQQPRGNDLKPRITLRAANGDVLTLANGLEARYFMSVDAILSVENGAEVKAGDVLARIPRESSKTRDITGGLPRVAELFEARKPKDFAIISEMRRPRRVRQGLQDQAPHPGRPERGGQGAGRIPHPQGQAYQRAGRGFRPEGRSPDGRQPGAARHPARARASRRWRAISSTRSRRSTGSRACKINDKHIEVIVRQMLQKVEIEDAGRDDLSRGRAGRPQRVRRGEPQGRAGRAAHRDRAIRCCRASPRRACRPARSSRRRRSRRRRGC